MKCFDESPPVLGKLSNTKALVDVKGERGFKPVPNQFNDTRPKSNITSKPNLLSKLKK